MSTERDRPVYCPNCGTKTTSGDRFCGVCGTAILSPPPQAEQVIPEPAVAAQAPTARRSRPLLLVGAIAILLILLVGTGAIALVAFNPGIGLLGDSSSQSQNTGGNAPEKQQTTTESTTSPKSDQAGKPQTTVREATQAPSPSTVSADDPPDPAFDELLPTLRERTSSVPIMLPADLPSVLDNVAIDPDLEDDRYGIAFFREPPENIVEQWSRPEVYGTLMATPKDESVSNEFFEATSVETFEMPDGAEATLRRMEPVSEQGGTQGPFWEGKFEEGNHDYTLILSDDTSRDMAAQVLSTVVEVPDEVESEEPSQGEEAQGVEAVEQFVIDYYQAVDNEDWSKTYSMLAEGSRQQFTEAEWIERQQTRQEVAGAPAEISSVSVDLNEEQVDAPATATVYFEDGTSLEIVIVEPVGDVGLKRYLTEEEVSYLKGLGFPR